MKTVPSVSTTILFTSSQAFSPAANGVCLSSSLLVPPELRLISRFVNACGLPLQALPVAPLPVFLMGADPQLDRLWPRHQQWPLPPLDLHSSANRFPPSL